MNAEDRQHCQNFEELLTTLKAEAAIYEEFLSLLQQKKQVVIANDVDALREIIHRENRLVRRIETITGERTVQAQSLGVLLKHLETTPTLQQLVEMAPRQFREEISRLRDLLKTRVEQIARVNSENAFLLHSALNLTRGIIGIFLRGEEDKQGHYLPNGQVSSQRTRQKMIDYQI